MIKDKRVAILVMGRTASGKTTTAKRLAQILGYKYISCAFYKRLIKPKYEKIDSLNDELRNKALELAVNEALKLINKESVILDSSFGRIIRRKYVIEKLANHVDALFLIYCISSNVDQTRRRIEARKGKENVDIQYHASSFKVFEYINQNFEEPNLNELNLIKGSKYIYYVDTFNAEIRPLKCTKDNLTKYLYKIIKYDVI